MMTILSRKRWTIAAVLVGLALYVAACSDAVYEITSPDALSFHVLLRKTYSVVAFTLVGFLFRKARAENGGRTFVVVSTIVATAAYSAAIEVGQFFAGSKEGLRWNAFDTACGALGGALATIDLTLASLRRR